MKFFLKLLIVFFIVNSGCSTNENINTFLAQGLMSGEPTESSIILQSRLTATDTIVDGDIPGSKGMGRFELSENDNFTFAVFSDWLIADSAKDYILKYKFSDLKPGTKYYYRLHYKTNNKATSKSNICSFSTNYGAGKVAESSFTVVTGMNYYFFHYGRYDISTAYSGKDKSEGYPALKSILDQKPDFFIGTGDNVYFDHPGKKGYDSAIKKGKNPHPGANGGKEVINERGMRRKYHEQFSQPRFVKLFSEVPTFWEKDDHDYRKNDADPFMDFPISHELGIKNFIEQLPVVDPLKGGKTFRTHHINKDLQLWFVEGRDYRDANSKDDGPQKTLWGEEQLNWLKNTLMKSDATFKILISPTPMVGPDDAYKKDNHVNNQGFNYEGEAFFDWIVENGFLEKNFYIICGDRHWQYHAEHPKGVEEFSCGALGENNSRAGRLAGDPKSTDPDGKIIQYYIQGKPEDASAGFLTVQNKIGDIPELHFLFFNEQGNLLYSAVKYAEL